ncbi:MAG: ATP-binding protein [Pseudomonadota bacterium]
MAEALGIANRSEDTLQALIQTERARRAQLRTRLGIGGIGFFLLALELGFAVPLAVFSVVVVSQIFDTWLKARIFRDGRTAPLTADEKWAMYLSNIQTAYLYGSVPIVAWLVPEDGFKIFAAFWLSGSMLHVMLHMHHDLKVFLSSFIPHASLTLILPLASAAFGYEIAPLTSGALLFATAVFISHFALAFRSYNAQSHALMQAQTLAEERRKAAEAANEAKSNFLATLSHEIRTPMNGIVGMAAALDSSDLPEEAQAQVDVMRQASDLLLVLLNDVLDMSKIEAGRLSLEKQPFSLIKAVNRVASLHEVEAGKRGIQLSVEVAPDAPNWRLGDEHRIIQVLHNLLGNAVKFTHEGSVTIRVRPSSSEGMTEIEVADTGIGMTPGEAKQVFEPFTQAQSSTSRQYGGTGLGLTITSGLIDAMGGRFELDTERGRGTTFTIFLPLPEAPEAGLPSAQAHDEKPIDLRGRRVLAIDDNSVNLAVLETVLKREGVITVTATSGAEGLELAKAADFDLVLLDIAMPHMDGPETLRRMRAEIDAQSLPPIIAVSAHAMQSDIERFLGEGFDGYVTKPVRRAALLQAATEALQAKRSAAA